MNGSQASILGEDVLIVGGGEIRLDDSPESSQHAHQKEYSNAKNLHNLGRSEGANFETPPPCRDGNNRQLNFGIAAATKNGCGSNTKSPLLESHIKMVGAARASSIVCRS